MDPHSNLESQLALARTILAGHGENGDCDALADLVVALHEWRVAGGYDPYDA